MFDFEWDAEKQRTNLEKHGVDFDDAISIFLGPTLEALDDRFDYGEARFVAYGEVGGHILAVVYTMRDEVCRIISARKARSDERRQYYAALAQGAQNGKD